MIEIPRLPPKGYGFSVCRIEPENNIHVILEAFADFKLFPVIIAGNFQGSEYGQLLRSKYLDNPNIYTLDPIYDPDKLNLLRGNCKIYLHGHSCGGTNPSLVEAMYLQLPVIAFDVNFNRETTENQARYFNSALQLQELCSTLQSTELTEIAEKMKSIADRRYNWQRISHLYAELF